MDRRIAERATELGRLGQWLQKVLPIGARYIAGAGLVAQAAFLETLVKNKRWYNAIATSLLCVDVVLQVELPKAFLLVLARTSLAPIDRRAKPLNLGRNRNSEPTFPSKPCSAAERKTNLRFGDVYRDWMKLDPVAARRFSLLSGNLRGVTDDQATCAILTAHSLFEVSDRVELAIRIVKDPEGAKQLSGVLKSLGLNGTHLGARLCEGNTLAGRGVGGLDLKAEAKKRVATPGTAGSIPVFPPGVLRSAIREVLREELAGKDVEFEDADEFWSKRWLWCVNGGHSRGLEHHDAKWKVQMKGRLHRRAVMEQWVANPVTEWDGTVHVSASEKQEHGKSRMILACDTASYVCFEHLMQPVEKAWRNKRVLLDPGKYGHTGMADRVRDLEDRGTVWLMLDYDDFNSQHSLAAMSMVIDMTCEMTNYPEKLRSRLINSFRDQRISAGGEYLGRATATLMSGHRCTSFINSVLNAAYLRASIGHHYHRLPVLHTGDDSVIRALNLGQVKDIIDGTQRWGLRMNPLKQSVGYHTAEFLRCAVRPGFCIGYAMRAIASAVSGSWVNPHELSATQKLRTYINAARTLSNRSARPDIAELLVTSVMRRTGISGAKASGLLRGKKAIDDGPIFSTDRVYSSYHVIEETSQVDLQLAELEREASSAYLSAHVTDVEQLALSLCARTPMSFMLDSSYRKTLTEEGGVSMSESLRLVAQRSKVAYGVEDAAVVGKRESLKETGLLTRYPLMHLVKGRLVGDALIEVLELAGWNGHGDPQSAAWGDQAYGAIIDGVTSYADASAMVGKTKAGVIKVSKPAYM